MLVDREDTTARLVTAGGAAGGVLFVPLCPQLVTSADDIHETSVHPSAPRPLNIPIDISSSASPTPVRALTHSLPPFN
ncbi:MAG TPA: hypothetical protein VH142_11155 [Polyangiaceae bacterium]|jgi:hypothetical protein|nr:hypothetical protein [Polyangiaceae bacterium]